MKKHVTNAMVKAWLGSDNLSVDSLVDLLTELANGEYTPTEFQSDVLNYEEQSK